MEIVVSIITSFATTGLASLWKLITDRVGVHGPAARDIDVIQADLRQMMAAVKDQYYKGDSNLSLEQQELVARVQDLAYDVEDCLVDYLRKVMSEGQTRENSHQFASDVTFLKNTSVKLCKDHDSAPKDSNPTTKRGPPTTYASEPCKPPVGMDKPFIELQKLVKESKSNRMLKVISIVGFGGLGKTLLARNFYNDEKEKFHLSAWVRADDKTPEQLLHQLLVELEKDAPSTSKVDVLPQAEDQSISEPHNAFSITSWFIRKLSPSALRDQVPKIVAVDATTSMSLNTTLRDQEKGKGIEMDNGTHDPTINEVDLLVKRLHSYLGTNRYLIAIIDMRKTIQWSAIRDAFPRTSGVDSRIIVTTTSQLVAGCCSVGNGHVYKMRPLTGDDPLKLFFHEEKRTDTEFVGKTDSLPILNKCDGLPLALLGASSSFGRKFTDLVTKRDEVIKNMCGQVAPIREEQNYSEDDTDTTKRMRNVLVSTFEGLPHPDVQMRLLYFCMFPQDHDVKKNSLKRQWLAEGLITGKDGGDTDLLTLMESCIIQSTEVSNNGQMKRCKVPGIVLEFITHKAKSRGFMDVCDVSRPEQPTHARRLSLHPNTHWNLPMEQKKIRTLAVFSKEGEASALENKEALAGYNMLRVLDLEGCGSVDDSDFENMCRNLGLLKYLSLGGSIITKVPREIHMLQWLETLDLRKTKIHMIPLEVLKLPQLRYLLGILLQLDRHGIFRKQDFFFAQTNKEMRKEIEAFLSSNVSKLEILSGFNTGKSRGFPQLLSHMTKLRKVKICCSSTADKKNMDGLSKGIRKFLCLTRMEDNGRSLSINITACPKEQSADDFLHSLAETPPSTLSTNTPPSKNHLQKILNKVKPKKKSVPTPSMEIVHPPSLYSLKLYGKLEKFPDFVTQLSSITDLCLSSTSLTPERVITGLNLRQNATLKFLKLAEQQLGHLEIGKDDLKSLQRICLVAETIEKITIKKEALPNLLSLHIICERLEGLSGIKFEGCILPSLVEVGLHSGVTDYTKGEWEATAMSHCNLPDVILIGPSKSTEEQGVPLAST